MRTEKDRPKPVIKPNRQHAKKCPNFIYFTCKGLLLQLFKTVRNMLCMSVHFAFKAAKGIFALALLNGNAWEPHSFTVETRIRGFGKSNLGWIKTGSSMKEKIPSLTLAKNDHEESPKFDSSNTFSRS